jgi:hypothetical protein
MDWSNRQRDNTHHKRTWTTYFWTPPARRYFLAAGCASGLRPPFSWAPVCCMASIGFA